MKIHSASSGLDWKVKLDGAESFSARRALACALGALVLTCCSAPARQDSVPAGAGEALPIAEHLDRIRGAYARGDEDMARAELVAAKQLPADEATQQYLTQFEALLDGRALLRSLLRNSRIEADRDPVTLGDPVTMRLVLECEAVAGKVAEVAIPRQVGGGLFSSRAVSSTRILANITTRDLDAYGGEHSRTDTIPVTPREDLVIPAGGKFALEFSFEGLGGDSVVARVLDVSVEIVPAETRFDGAPVYLTRLQLPSCAVVALPSGYEEFASDPMGSLVKVLDRADAASDRSVLPCTLVVPKDRHEEANVLLATKLLGANHSRSLAIITALRELTGERERGLDRAAWIGYASKLLATSGR